MNSLPLHSTPFLFLFPRHLDRSFNSSRGFVSADVEAPSHHHSRPLWSGNPMPILLQTTSFSLFLTTWIIELRFISNHLQVVKRGGSSSSAADFTQSYVDSGPEPRRKRYIERSADNAEDLFSSTNKRFVFFYLSLFLY